MTQKQKDIVKKWKKIYRIKKLPRIIFKKKLKNEGKRADGVSVGNLIMIDEPYRRDIKNFEAVIAHELFHFINGKCEDRLLDIFAESDLDGEFWNSYDQFIDQIVQRFIKKLKTKKGGE